MKSFIIFAFLAFFATLTLAQEYAQKSLDVPTQGWYKQRPSNGAPVIYPRIQFLNSLIGWLGVFYTTDGGNHWDSTADGRAFLQFIDPLHGWSTSPINHGGNNVWISSTTNGGQTWIDYDMGFNEFSRMVFATKTQGYCNISQRIAHTNDEGLWCPPSIGQFLLVVTLV